MGPAPRRRAHPRFTRTSRELTNLRDSRTGMFTNKRRLANRRAHEPAKACVPETLMRISAVEVVHQMCLLRLQRLDGVLDHVTDVDDPGQPSIGHDGTCRMRCVVMVCRRSSTLVSGDEVRTSVVMMDDTGASQHIRAAVVQPSYHVTLGDDAHDRRAILRHHHGTDVVRGQDGQELGHRARPGRMVATLVPLPRRIVPISIDTTSVQPGWGIPNHCPTEPLPKQPAAATHVILRLRGATVRRREPG